MGARGVTQAIELRRMPAVTRDAVERFRAASAGLGGTVYVVGGVVRDLLLGRDAVDVDLACDLSLDSLRVVARRAGADAVFAVNDRFDTLGVRFGEARLDVTRFRGAPGDDTPAAALENDLALRDFTINAMAFAPPVPGATSAPLIDPHGGAADLTRRTLRGVREPLARLREDPLRALRAVRLAAALEMTIEAETRAAVIAVGAAVGTVSVERIGAELGRLLVSADPATGLRLLVDLRLMPVVLPELDPLVTFRAPDSKDLWVHTLRVVASTPPDIVTRWAALLHDAAKPKTYRVAGGETRFFGHEAVGAGLARSVLSRLRLDGPTIEGVSSVVAAHARPAHYDSTWTDGAVRRLMLDLGSRLPNLLALARADVTSARQDARARARQRISGLENHINRLRDAEDLARFVSPLDGDELMALFDRPPGRWIKVAKDRLRELVLDGELAVADKTTATALVTAWNENGELAEPGSGPSRT